MKLRSFLVTVLVVGLCWITPTFAAPPSPVILFSGPTVAPMSSAFDFAVGLPTQADAVFYVDTSTGKVYVNNALVAVNKAYSADTIYTTTGTYVSGDVTDIQVSSDGNTYDVDEVSGVPGFDITAEFSGVAEVNRVTLRTQYTGGSGHTINVDIYNWGLTQWDTLNTFTDQAAQEFVTADVLDDTNYVSGADSVNIRLYHSDTGNIAHDIAIDYITVGMAVGGGGGGDSSDWSTYAASQDVDAGGNDLINVVLVDGVDLDGLNTAYLAHVSGLAYSHTNIDSHIDSILLHSNSWVGTATSDLNLQANSIVSNIITAEWNIASYATTGTWTIFAQPTGSIASSYFARVSIGRSVYEWTDFPSFQVHIDDVSEGDYNDDGSQLGLLELQEYPVGRTEFVVWTANAVSGDTQYLRTNTTGINLDAYDGGTSNAAQLYLKPGGISYLLTENKSFQYSGNSLIGDTIRGIPLLGALNFGSNMVLDSGNMFYIWSSDTLGAADNPGFWESGGQIYFKHASGTGAPLGAGGDASTWSSWDATEDVGFGGFNITNIGSIGTGASRIDTLFAALVDATAYTNISIVVENIDSGSTTANWVIKSDGGGNAVWGTTGTAPGDNLGDHEITQDLLPDVASTHNLGSLALPMLAVYADSIISDDIDGIDVSAFYTSAQAHWALTTEHLDWSSDLGGTQINSANYTDSDTFINTADGALDMATYAITNVGDVDGVDISALDTSVTNHIADTGNPHTVYTLQLLGEAGTADQVLSREAGGTIYWKNDAGSAPIAGNNINVNGQTVSVLISSELDIDSNNLVNVENLYSGSNTSAVSIVLDTDTINLVSTILDMEVGYIINSNAGVGAPVPGAVNFNDNMVLNVGNKFYMWYSDSLIAENNPAIRQSGGLPGWENVSEGFKTFQSLESNSFFAWLVAGQGALIATDPDSAITLVAGSGISLATSPAGDILTISVTSGGGSVAINDLLDATGSASIVTGGYTIALDATSADIVAFSTNGLISAAGFISLGADGERFLNADNFTEPTSTILTRGAIYSVGASGSDTELKYSPDGGIGKSVYRFEGQDVALEDGGTGASNAFDARANLGVAINVDVAPGMNMPTGNKMAWDVVTDDFELLDISGRKIAFRSYASTTQSAYFNVEGDADYRIEMSVDTALGSRKIQFHEPSDAWIISGSGFEPATDGTIDFGADAKRWKAGYFNTIDAANFTTGAADGYRYFQAVNTGALTPTTGTEGAWWYNDTDDRLYARTAVEVAETIAWVSDISSPSLSLEDLVNVTISEVNGDSLIFSSTAGDWVNSTITGSGLWEEIGTAYTPITAGRGIGNTNTVVGYTYMSTLEVARLTGTGGGDVVIGDGPADNLRPQGDNAQNLGEGGFRWATVYGTSLQIASIYSIGSAVLFIDSASPNSNDTYNLGSSGANWLTGYITTLDADNLVDSSDTSIALQSHIVPDTDSKWSIGSAAYALLSAYVDSVIATDVSGTNLDFSGTGKVAGAFQASLKVSTSSSASVILTSDRCLGDLHNNGDNDVIDYTLPAAVAGLSCAVYTRTANVITVDAGTGDSIVLPDGTTLTAANAADSSGSAGGYGYFVAIDSTYWVIMGSNRAWSDGGVD